MNGRDVTTAFVKNQMTLAFKWLLEHHACLKYQLRVADAERFCITFPPYSDDMQHMLTPEDLADLVVEDHIAGATPWQGN